MKVKICGVTNTEDAKWVANLGADFLGLNFYSGSPRKVSVKNAKDIAAQLPPFIKIVGVFVNEPLESLTKIIKAVPLKFVQLHGSEDVDYCRSAKALGVSVIKVLGVEKPLAAEDVAPYLDTVDYFMFDHKTEALPGGTGEAFNWEWLQNTSFITKPWFLAGGLKPDNIAKAIKATKAQLVDVCSGVERTPTRKNYDAMKQFIEVARSTR